MHLKQRCRAMGTLFGAPPSQHPIRQPNLVTGGGHVQETIFELKLLKKIIEES